MRDFTLTAYKEYLWAIKCSYKNILRFEEYFCAKPKPENFCLIRHDVDRRAENALRMAKLENERSVKATYFFRAKSHTFKPQIIATIASLGHEVGYHYESLSDANGDMSAALKDFEKNLNKFREIVPVKTISMHGRPLKAFDNRDMWRTKENHDKLTGIHEILGEVYIDIDYTDIAYINDTGRNWTSGKSNKRDKVISNIEADFANGGELLEYLYCSPHPKMLFQVHPERWTDTPTAWLIQYLSDAAVNIIKVLSR